MSLWVWIAVGVGSFLVLGLSAALAVGAVLGRIGRRVTELHETEEWMMAPPSRAAADTTEPQPEEAEATSGRVIRLR